MQKYYDYDSVYSVRSCVSWISLDLYYILDLNIFRLLKIITKLFCKEMLMKKELALVFTTYINTFKISLSWTTSSLSSSRSFRMASENSFCLSNAWTAPEGIWQRCSKEEKKKVKAMITSVLQTTRTVWQWQIDCSRKQM